jgi:hypothetical protein
MVSLNDSSCVLNTLFRKYFSKLLMTNRSDETDGSHFFKLACYGTCKRIVVFQKVIL